MECLFEINTAVLVHDVLFIDDLQVTCEYRMEKGACIPVRVHTVVISLQHSDDVTTSQLRKQIMDEVVAVVIPRQYVDAQTVFHIQPSGRFVIGGPQVIILYTYISNSSSV